MLPSEDSAETRITPWQEKRRASLASIIPFLRKSPLVENAISHLEPTVGTRYGTGFTGDLIFKVLLIAVSALFIYAPAFHGTWLWDDDTLISNNVINRDPAGLLKIWSGRGGVDFLPVTQSAFWAMWQMFGENPTAFHLLNVALHIIGALLVWRLFWRLGIPLAWLGGLGFAIHPLLVESVAWMAELKNTLSLPILLLAMLAWLRFDETRRPLDYWLTAGLFLAAILAKAAAVMFPFVLLLFAWWKHGRLTWTDLKQTAVFFFISLVIGIVTIYFQHSIAIGIEHIPVGGLLSRTLIAGISVVFYLWKFLLPVGLITIYPRWDVDPPSLLQLLPWPAIALLLFWFWKKRATWGRHAALGFGFFLLTVAPALGFVTMSYMRITWAADHFVHLPIIGLLGLAVAGSGVVFQRALPAQRRMLVGGGLLVFAALIFQSHRYAAVFQDSFNLWSYTLERNPDAWQAHSLYANEIQKRGDIEGAFQHVLTSQRLRPDLAETNNNVAVFLETRGQLEDALEYARKAMALQPGFPTFRKNLARLLVRTGRDNEALPLYDQLLKEAPPDALLYCNYGAALCHLNRYDEGVAAFQRALEIDPNQKEARLNLESIEKAKAGGNVAPGKPSGTPGPAVSP